MYAPSLIHGEVLRGARKKSFGAAVVSARMGRIRQVAIGGKEYFGALKHAVGKAGVALVVRRAAGPLGQKDQGVGSMS
jgi:hypothetical protein